MAIDFPKDFLSLHKTLSRLPLGIYVFSGVVGFVAPYSASVSPCVEVLDDTQCEVTISDFWWHRNPFSSIHAIALANLGEQTSGILMVCLLQKYKQLRAIPKRIDTEYLKKARGIIRGKSGGVDLSLVGEKNPKCDIAVVTKMFDTRGDLVAQTTVTWALEFRGPKKHN